MSDVHHPHNPIDLAPGDEDEGRIGPRLIGYVIGLGLALLLTATSFFVAGTDLVWQPSIPVAIIVLAIAQMGVHLVFFLHITTGADNTNIGRVADQRPFLPGCCGPDSALHLHDLVHRHHVVIEVRHDPQRPCDHQKDDQKAEGER